MAGHSKWAILSVVKQNKMLAVVKYLPKFIRELTTAARLGGGDAQLTHVLGAVVDKALSRKYDTWTPSTVQSNVVLVVKITTI